MSSRRPPPHTPRSVCKLFSDRPAAYVYPNCQTCSIFAVFFSGPPDALYVGVGQLQ
jgi:hypothetical protein